MSILPEDLQPIAEKIENKERLTKEEGIFLMEHPNLAALGYLADRARKLKTGKQVFFNNNAHINYSNLCVMTCKLCNFYKNSADEEGAYTMDREQILEKARAYYQAGVRELHIVGGLHPDLPYQYYLDILKSLRTEMPDISLKAFTAVEIDYFAKREGLSSKEVLLELKEAGQTSLPGGGAELFSSRVRPMIARGKISGEKYLAIHQEAHSLGLPTNATMLYGHIETTEERIDHLIQLREAQDESGGFQCFIPLGFHPENTELAHLAGPSGYDDLRVIAVSRLMLDNFEYIKAYWVMLTPKLAQISLAFGANDLDGTVREEKIYHAAGSKSPHFQSIETLVRLIRDSGNQPVERDSIYNIVREY